MILENKKNLCIHISFGVLCIGSGWELKNVMFLLMVIRAGANKHLQWGLGMNASFTHSN